MAFLHKKASRTTTQKNMHHLIIYDTFLQTISYTSQGESISEVGTVTQQCGTRYI